MTPAENDLLNRLPWDRALIDAENSWGGVAAFLDESNPCEKQLILFPMRKDNIDLCLHRANRISQERIADGTWQAYCLRMKTTTANGERDWPYVVIVYEK